jgi:hypothetical protein
MFTELVEFLLLCELEVSKFHHSRYLLRGVRNSLDILQKWLPHPLEHNLDITFFKGISQFNGNGWVGCRPFLPVIHSFKIEISSKLQTYRTICDEPNTIDLKSEPINN